MARILDTIPEFEAYARRAGLESRVVRETLWRQMYEGAHQKIFNAFFDGPGSRDGLPALVRELARVRERARDAVSVVSAAIEEIDSAVAKQIGAAEAEPPLHILMVGTFTANAAVGRIDDDLVVFHCLEWYQTPEGARVLAAHEATHAWHERRVAPPEDEDVPWLLLSEGLAIHASRAVVPGRPDHEYFWYGHPGFDDWLQWCRDHRTELWRTLQKSLDDPEAADVMFGSGRIDGRWRVGFWLADEVVARLDRPLDDIASLEPDEARAAVRGVVTR